MKQLEISSMFTNHGAPLYVYKEIEIIPPNPNIKQEIISLESQNESVQHINNVPDINLVVGGFTKKHRSIINRKRYKTKKNKPNI